MSIFGTIENGMSNPNMFVNGIVADRRLYFGIRINSRVSST